MTTISPIERRRQERRDRARRRCKIYGCGSLRGKHAHLCDGHVRSLTVKGRLEDWEDYSREYQQRSLAEGMARDQAAARLAREEGGHPRAIDAERDGYDDCDDDDRQGFPDRKLLPDDRAVDALFGANTDCDDNCDADNTPADTSEERTMTTTATKKSRAKKGPCVDCGREMRIKARGLCSKCYGRRRRAGTLDEIPPKIQPSEVTRTGPDPRSAIDELEDLQRSLKEVGRQRDEALALLREIGRRLMALSGKDAELPLVQHVEVISGYLASAREEIVRREATRSRVKRRLTGVQVAGRPMCELEELALACKQREAQARVALTNALEAAPAPLCSNCGAELVVDKRDGDRWHLPPCLHCQRARDGRNAERIDVLEKELNEGVRRSIRTAARLKGETVKGDPESHLEQLALDVYLASTRVETLLECDGQPFREAILRVPQIERLPSRTITDQERAYQAGLEDLVRWAFTHKVQKIALHLEGGGFGLEVERAGGQHA